MTVDRIRDALALMVADPAATGGLWLRGRAGPLRDRVLAALAPLGARRLPPGTDEAALSGGLDLAPTLAQGRAVWRPGLLDRPGVLILPMAERCPAGLAARLAQAMDAGSHTLIALDESAGPDDALPAALADRLGLFVDLDGLSAADLRDLAPPAAPVADAAPANLPPDAVAQVVALADRLGVMGPRGVLATLAAARGLARAEGRAQATDRDLARAAALTLA
ncbi:MAG: magnesium chelatase ATPase subunit D, partial [Rhodobacterales bacterium]|nr:magnesium chelatase ATPase subunit D [Rhodobacterales bacterium]